MKKSLYLLIIFLFSTFLLKSQHVVPVWVKQFGGSTGAAYFSKNFIQKDSHGNFLISAHLYNAFIDTTFLNGGIIAKYTPNGQLLLVEKTDTTNNYPISFKTGKHGGNIYMFSYFGLDSNYYRTYELGKYDTLLKKMWSKRFRYKETMFFPNSGLFGIEINKSEDIFIGWHLKDAHLILPEGDTIPRENIYHIFKYDSSGTFVNDYTPFGLGTIVNDLVTDSYENNIHLVSGYLGEGIMRFDQDYSTVLSAVQTQEGVENIFSDIHNNIYVTTYPGGSYYQFYLSKHQTWHYALEWQKHFKGFTDTIPHPQNPSINMVYRTQFGLAKVATYNDDVYVMGYFTHKMEIDGHVFNTLDNRLMSFFITKFDSDGNYYWTEVFHTKDYLSYWTYPDIIIGDDGFLYCGLMFKSEIQIADSIYQSQGNNNIIFMRLEETGVGIAPANDNWGFRVYPNPACQNIFIDITSDSFEKGHLFIYDITGRLVLKQSINNLSGRHEYDISHLKAGLYIVTISSNEGFHTTKLIVY